MLFSQISDLWKKKCAKVDETQCVIVYDEDASEFPLSPKKVINFLHSIYSDYI